MASYIFYNFFAIRSKADKSLQEPDYNQKAMALKPFVEPELITQLAFQNLVNTYCCCVSKPVFTKVMDVLTNLLPHAVCSEITTTRIGSISEKIDRFVVGHPLIHVGTICHTGLLLISRLKALESFIEVLTLLSRSHGICINGDVLKAFVNSLHLSNSKGLFDGARIHVAYLLYSPR